MTHGQTVLETERMVLRNVSPHEDAAFMLTLLNDPEFVRYVGDRGVRTVEEAEQYLVDRVGKHYDLHGFGMYVTVARADGASMGLCGLVQRDNLEHPDIGFAFLPGYRGKGYAYESALAVVNYARNELGLRRVLAMVLPSNERSVALLRKLGLEYERPYRLPDEDVALALYGRTLLEDG